MISIQEQDYSKTNMPLTLSEFAAECTDLSIQIVGVVVLGKGHQHRISRMLTHERHGSKAFVACLSSFTTITTDKIAVVKMRPVVLEHCIYIK